MAADDLRLNSLEGFSKKSPRFILEEHGGCEVPAGCGGVVLRWVDPDAGLPVLLDFFHRTPATLFIDGVSITTSQVLVAPGRHVLSVEFAAPPDDTEALLILAGRLKITAPNHGDQVVVRSVGDGSWRFAAGPTPAGWMTELDLRAGGRTQDVLVHSALTPPQQYSPGWYVFDRASEHGGQPIGIPRPSAGGPIHVRTVFAVPRVSP